LYGPLARVPVHGQHMDVADDDAAVEVPSGAAEILAIHLALVVIVQAVSATVADTEVAVLRIRAELPRDIQARGPGVAEIKRGVGDVGDRVATRNAARRQRRFQ